MAAYIDLPYQAEYAKSGRASCKLCRIPIDKDSLRLAVMVQSPHFDGKVPNWHHFNCFWSRVRCVKTDDIHGYNNIRWEDQERIKKAIEGLNVGKKPMKGKSSLSGGGVVADDGYSDYKVEYAKSSRSTCRACNNYIDKDVLRLSKKDYTGESAMMYGPQEAWYHLDCFNEHRTDLQFSEFMDPSKIPGYKKLAPDDKKLLTVTLGKGNKQKRKAKLEMEDVEPAVKVKKEVDEEEERLKQQSKLVWEIRDNLQRNLTNAILKALLEYNKIQVPTGENKLLDCVSDAMAFGTPAPCPECQGQLRLSGSIDGYRCIGDVSGWTKCQYITDDPERVGFIIPKKYLEYPFLSSYKYQPRKRYFAKSSNKSVERIQSSSQSSNSQNVKQELNMKPSTSSLSQPSASLSSTSSAKLKPTKPLQGLRVSSCGKLTMKREEMKELVERLGGRLMDANCKNPDFCISNADNMTSTNKHMKKWQDSRVPVVDVDFLTDLEGNKDEDFITIIKKHIISTWPCDPDKIIHVKPAELRPSNAFVKKEVMSQKETPMMAKMVVKGGAAVDPLSELEYEAHVLQGKSKKDLYNSVLGLVDVAKGTNSFYKLQLLEADHGHEWWLFRSWGRVGTSIGGHKLEEYDDKEEAIDAFERLYLEKSGNRWKDRHAFKKVPHRFYPLDIDYGNDAEEDGADKLTSLISASSSSSSLAPEVQNLVRLIFDVENMKKAMLEFEIDLRKMPLGKLSKKQIESAYRVLTEAQDLINNNGTNTRILDASNRFYTLIPHDFGLMKPPLLDNDDIIKLKVGMLDNLLEIEIAYNLLVDSKGGKGGDVDQHYNKLKTDISVLDKASAEFARICQYVKNTHAATHNDYDLEVLEVFTINRHGESKVYQPFKDLHNRMLLWHGSRLTNYAGILSKGLRIAPKEAPSTGYMFGKGIYFADMASKSANYCVTSKQDPTGLMLLSEVALGNMHELTQANFITELPKGKHSVKGLGTTAPDPKHNFVCEDGVIIPMGKGVKTRVKLTSLLYNEYIVYDVAQVNIKYLLKLNFKYKRSSSYY